MGFFGVIGLRIGFAVTGLVCIVGGLATGLAVPVCPALAPVSVILLEASAAFEIGAFRPPDPLDAVVFTTTGFI